MKAIYIAVALLLVSSYGESQKPPKFAGPDGKPLPGRPGGATLQINHMEDPTAFYLEILKVADFAEVQQLRDPRRLSGTFGTPTVIWTKTSDTFYSLAYPDDLLVGVTRYTGGVRVFELLKATNNLHEDLYGALSIFAANLPNCTDAFWVQYLRRRDEFVTKSSDVPITKNVPPEIDERAPYRIQKQVGPGAAFMNDFAGAKGPIGSPTIEAAKAGIPWYEHDAGMSAQDVTRLAAHYHFWTYAICQKPVFAVAGHLEWGYTTHLDLLKEPHVKTEREPVTWVQNF